MTIVLGWRKERRGGVVRVVRSHFGCCSDEPDGLHELSEFFDAAGFCLGLVCEKGGKSLREGGKNKNEVGFLRTGGEYLPMVENAWKKLAM